jgi:hypothetical protein
LVVTVDAVPVVQRLVVGTAVRDWVFEVPHEPFTAVGAVYGVKKSSTE